MKTLSRLTLFATTVTILIFICHALMTENLSKLEKERSYYRFSFPPGSNVERAIKEWKRYTYKRPVNIGLLIFPTPNVAHCYQAKFGSLEKSLLYKGRLPKKGEGISNYNNNEKQKQVGALAISPKIIKYSIYPLTEIVDIYYTNTVYITGEPTQRAKAESFIAKYGDLKAEKETYTLHGANQYIGKVSVYGKRGQELQYAKWYAQVYGLSMAGVLLLLILLVLFRVSSYYRIYYQKVTVYILHGQSKIRILRLSILLQTVVVMIASLVIAVITNFSWVVAAGGVLAVSMALVMIFYGSYLAGKNISGLKRGEK